MLVPKCPRMTLIEGKVLGLGFRVAGWEFRGLTRSSISEGDLGLVGAANCDCQVQNVDLPRGVYTSSGTKSANLRR